MDTLSYEFIKLREIHFRVLDPKAEPATAAMLLLLGATGIEDIRILTPHCVQLRYDINHLTLQIIEEALTDVGFHLDNSLLCKMKRALFYYTEETQLANMGRSHDKANSTLDIFINCYNLRQHGCRDTRPEYLRQHS